MINTLRGSAWFFGMLIILPSSLHAQDSRPIREISDPTGVLRDRPERREREDATVLQAVTPTSFQDELQFEATLSSVRFTGSTIYTDSELEPLWSELRGEVITEQEAFEIAAAVTEKYQEGGFLMILAVPEAPDETGVLPIQIVEGYVANVMFEGDDTSRHPLLLEYSKKIMASRPLKADILDRYLRLMNDLPGIGVMATLQPPPDPEGAETLILDVSYKSMDYLATLDNRGTRYVGKWLASVGIRQNSALTGTHDQASVQFYTAVPDHDEIHALEFEANHPIGTEGATISTDLILSRVKPGYLLEPIDIESNYKELSVAISYPKIRLERESLWYFANFNYTNVNSNAFDGGVKLLKDRVRALRFGLTYVKDNPWEGSNSASLELSRGVDIMGATDKGSPLSSHMDGSSDFTKLNLFMTHWQPLSADWAWLAEFDAQYAFDPLLSSEKIAFGGEDILRAYDSSLLVGDHGAALKLELEYSPITELFFMPRWYGYFEAGKAWIRESEFIDSSSSATAAGLGLRFEVTSYFSGYAEVGWPLSSPDYFDGSSGPRGFLGLSVRY